MIFLWSSNQQMRRGIPYPQRKQQRLLIHCRKHLMRLWLPAKTATVSFATIWRIAERAGIELTAGREQDIAAGVSRSTVWRIERGRRGSSAAGCRNPIL
jgi:hypothetical protein